MTRVYPSRLLTDSVRKRLKKRHIDKFGSSGDLNDLAKRYIAGVRRESKNLSDLAAKAIHRNMSYRDVVVALSDIQEQLAKINKYIRMTHARL